MERFRGNILSGDQVLLENVEGVLFVNESANGWKTWDGTFDLPAGKYIEVGGPYRLQLDDGRSGKIVITRVQSNNTGRNVVEFKGSGPLR